MAVRNRPVKSVSVSFQSQAGPFFLVLVEKSRKRTRRCSGFSCRKGHVLVSVGTSPTQGNHGPDAKAPHGPSLYTSRNDSNRKRYKLTRGHVVKCEQQLVTAGRSGYTVQHEIISERGAAVLA